MRVETLLAGAISSNVALLSDSEGEYIFPCSRLEDEKAIVLVVDKNEEDMGIDIRNDGTEVKM